MNRVLVVSASPIIRIVVARTIERIYLKPIPVSAEAALNELVAQQPTMVIVDAAASIGLLDSLFAELGHRRSASEKGLPRVLVIGNPEAASSVPFAGLVDATIAKPFTPDMLQPVVERVIQGS